METLIEAVRSALREDADHAARSAGLEACRKILAVLVAATASEPREASATPPSIDPDPASAPSPMPPPNEPEPTTASSTPPSETPATPPVQPMDPGSVATLFASLGKLPPEQLLDLAITRLRAALPPGATVAAPTPLRFQLVPLHHLRGTK